MPVLWQNDRDGKSLSKYSSTQQGTGGAGIQAAGLFFRAALALVLASVDGRVCEPMERDDEGFETARVVEQIICMEIVEGVPTVWLRWPTSWTGAREQRRSAEAVNAAGQV